MRLVVSSLGIIDYWQMADRFVVNRFGSFGNQFVIP
jgi:hypothetical protein